MLGKLFKHEMKAMSRLLLPLLLVLAALTIIDSIVISLDIFHGTLEIIPGFLIFAYVILIIAVVVVTFVLIIQRFYKNLMKDEGYLMFTLPVKSYQLINSKLFASLLWSIVCSVALIISILVVSSGSIEWADVVNGFQMVMDELNRQFNGSAAVFIVEMIVMILLSVINNILIIYASIAIGQLSNNHKVLASFGAYIGITIVLQIIGTICIAMMRSISGDTFNSITSVTHILFPLIILSLLVTNAIYYVVTDYIFKKRINLE